MQTLQRNKDGVFNICIFFYDLYDLTEHLYM